MSQTGKRKVGLVGREGVGLYTRIKWLERHGFVKTTMDANAFRRCRMLECFETGLPRVYASSAYLRNHALCYDNFASVSLS